MELHALEIERQEAIQAVKRADAELKAAQQELEWASKALRLAEESLSSEEELFPDSLPAANSAMAIEAKANIGRLQPGKFSSMTPEAVLKEVQDMGDQVSPQVLIAALRALPPPVEQIGSSLLDTLENQAVALSSLNLAAALNACSDLQIERASVWSKLSLRMKTIIKSRHGRHLKASEICACVSSLAKADHLDSAMAELLVAQARPIASEFKPTELVATLVGLSQVPAGTHFQLGELLDSVVKLANRFQVSEVTQLLAVVSGLPSSQQVNTVLAAVFRDRSGGLTWEGVASALIVLGRKKGNYKLELVLDLCEHGNKLAPSGSPAELADLLAALAQIAARHAEVLTEERFRSLVRTVAKQLVHAESFDTSSLVNALVSLGQLSQVGVDAGVVDALATRAGELAASFSGRQVGAVVRAIAELGSKDHPVFESLLDHALAGPTHLPLSDVSELVAALVLLGDNGPRFKELCDRAVKCTGWTPGLLLKLLETMVTLPHPTLLAKLISEATHKTFDRKDIVATLPTLAALAPQTDTLKQKFYGQLQKELKYLTPRESLELLETLAKNESQKDDLFQKVCEAFTLQPTIELDVAEGALRLLSALRWDHQPLLKKLTSMPVPPQCPPVTLVSLFRSLAVFNFRPGPFLQALSAQTLNVLSSINEQQAIDIAEALLSLEHEAPGVIEPLVLRVKPGGAAPPSWPQVALSLRLEHQDWVIELPRLGEPPEQKLESRPLVLAISAALTRAQIPHRVNVFIEGLQVDIALDGSMVLLRVADEENCLHHSRLSVGSMLFRDRLLQKMQWKVARVGYFEWGILRGVAAAEERFISGKVAAATPTEPTPTPPPVTVHAKETHSDDEDLYYADDDRVL